MPPVPPQPTLTDGDVVLRPWRDEDIEVARLAHDEEIARWFGFPAVIPSYEQHADAVRRWREKYADGRSTVNFLIEHRDQPAGTVEIRDAGDHRGELSWALYSGTRGHGIATRAVRLLIRYAFDELGMARVEARVDPANVASLRVAGRAGLRREGVLRQHETIGAERRDHVILARLAADDEPSEGAGFRAILNAGLPRKRAIAQLLVQDHEQRVLLCQLTYKADWDLPGGVVEVGESPAVAVVREVKEELALELPADGLLVVDWLPPWSGWDDALCLVFDGGVHEGSILDAVVLEPREIVSAEFCTAEQFRARCRDFTARRIEQALAAVGGDGAEFLHSGVAHFPDSSD